MSLLCASMLAMFLAMDPGGSSGSGAPARSNVQADGPSTEQVQPRAWVRLVFTDPLDADHPSHMATKRLRLFEVTEKYVQLGFFLARDIYVIDHAEWQVTAGPLATVMETYAASGTPALPEHTSENEVVVYVRRRGSMNGAERTVAFAMASEQRATVGRQHTAPPPLETPAVTGEPAVMPNNPLTNTLAALAPVQMSALASHNGAQVPVQDILAALQRFSTMIVNNPIAMGPGMMPQAGYAGAGANVKGGTKPPKKKQRRGNPAETDAFADVYDEDEVSMPNVTHVDADDDDEAFQALGPNFGLDRGVAPNPTPGTAKPYLFKFDEHTRRGLKMEDGYNLRFRLAPPVTRDAVIRKIMNYVMWHRRQQNHPRPADFTIIVCHKDGNIWQQRQQFVTRPAAREKNHYIVLPRDSVRAGAEPPMEINEVNLANPELAEAATEASTIPDSSAEASTNAGPSDDTGLQGTYGEQDGNAALPLESAQAPAASAAQPSVANREVELCDKCVCLICGAMLKEVVFMTAVPCGDTCICIDCVAKQVPTLYAPSNRLQPILCLE